MNKTMTREEQKQRFKKRIREMAAELGMMDSDGPRVALYLRMSEFSADQTVVIELVTSEFQVYEHREEADHHALTLTLRSLLFGIREGVV